MWVCPTLRARRDDLEEVWTLPVALTRSFSEALQFFHSRHHDECQKAPYILASS